MNSSEDRALRRHPVLSARNGRWSAVGKAPISEHRIRLPEAFKKHSEYTCTSTRDIVILGTMALSMNHCGLLERGPLQTGGTRCRHNVRINKVSAW